MSTSLYTFNTGTGNKSPLFLNLATVTCGSGAILPAPPNSPSETLVDGDTVVSPTLLLCKYILILCIHLHPWDCVQAYKLLMRERSGSVVECLTRDRRVAGSSLTGVIALWSLSKTHLS